MVQAEGSSYEINMDMNLNPSEDNDVISPDNKSLETIRAAVDNCSPNGRNTRIPLHSLSKVLHYDSLAKMLHADLTSQVSLLV